MNNELNSINKAPDANSNEGTKPELATELFLRLHSAQRNLQAQLGEMTLEEISEYQRMIAPHQQCFRALNTQKSAEN